MKRRGLSAEQVGDGITRLLASQRPADRMSKAARVARVKKGDFGFFCRYYLAQHFQSEPAGFHGEMVDLLRQHDRVAVAAPREHAKSTVVSFAFVLFAMLAGLHHFVVIVRDSEDIARQNVDDIRRELEDNERIVEDFGEQTGRKWTEGEFVTPSGVKVIGRGRGSTMRGLRWKQYRPGLVILDDIEDDASVDSKAQRDKLDRWFRRSVSNIVGLGGKIFIVGTILHHDSWLKRILDGGTAGVYQTRVWKSITYTAAGKPELLWPSQWPLARLEQKRKEIGSRAFESEFQNNPANEEDQIFSPSWWKFYSDDELAGVHLDVVAAIDVAIGLKAKNDETANVVIGHGNGRYHVLRCTMKRIRVSQQVEMVCETYREFPQILRYGFERIAYQDALKQLVDDRSRQECLQIPAVGVEDISSDKIKRISRLAPLAEQGLLLWPDASSAFWSRDMVRCREQFEALGCSADSHDDGPDAVERAISLLRGKTARKGKVTLL